MQTLPSFHFQVGDFLVATTGMTLRETGVYIRLLLLQWAWGGIPSDIRSLRRALGTRSIPGENVLRYFPQGADGLLRNAELDRLRRECGEFGVNADDSEGTQKLLGKSGGKSRAKAAPIPPPPAVSETIVESTACPPPTSAPTAPSEEASTTLREPAYWKTWVSLHAPRRRWGNEDTSSGKLLRTAWTDLPPLIQRAITEAMNPGTDLVPGAISPQRR